MKKKLTSLLLLGIVAGTAAASDSPSPKIIMGIMVDQLRTDYLEQLRPYFGQSGFNRLMSEGVYMPDVDFHNVAADALTGTAIVYTGAWPTVNGVASAEILDADSRRHIPILASKSRPYSDFSPENLKVSTIADELLINNGTLSKVFSVGGDAQTAVATAGHGGSSAVWFDEISGRWTTSPYYGTIPPVISNKNRNNPVAAKISGSPWRPLKNATAYAGGNLWNPGDFNYTFGGSGRDTYLRFKSAAPFNSEVTDAALDILKSMQTAGTSSQGGMLSVNYSLAPYPYDFDGDNRPELIDSYVRLDADLGRLIDAATNTFGADNLLIFLSSTGYANDPNIPDAKVKLPTGEITLKQAESLLNSYLSASYGNGDYVSLIKNGKLYLDSKFAASKNIDIRKLRAESKEFLLKMSGISEAFTIDEIIRGENVRAKDMALGIDAKNSPDIFLFFNPGWVVTDDNAYPVKTEKVRLTTPSVPAFILAPGISPQLITESVEATAIAPTISSLMRIRAPNAAASRPLYLTKNTGK